MEPLRNQKKKKAFFKKITPYISRKLRLLKDTNEWEYVDIFNQTGLPNSDNHIKKIMDGLKKALSDFYEDEPVKLPRFPPYARQIESREPIWLEPHEQDLVIEMIPSMHKPIAIFLAKEGVRMGEVRALKWDCINVERQTALIKRAFAGNRLNEYTKTRQQRTIALADESIEAIKSMPRAVHHDFVFHWRGRPYGNTALWKALRAALDAAGFQHVKPQGFGRHAVASQWTMAGAPTRAVQQHLGHSDIRTTERYAHVKPKRWGDRSQPTATTDIPMVAVELVVSRQERKRYGTSNMGRKFYTMPTLWT